MEQNDVANVAVYTYLEQTEHPAARYSTYTYPPDIDNTTGIKVQASA